MIKKTFVFSLALTLTTSAIALADVASEPNGGHGSEKTFCRFKSEGKSRVHCKVEIEERKGHGGVTTGNDGGQFHKLALEVNCSNGFRLEDDHAKEVDKRDFEFIIGAKHGKFAFLAIEDDNNGGHHENREKAVLLISHNDGALRLEGKCFEKDFDLNSL